MNGGSEGRFPATKRLKRRSDFRRVYSYGVARRGKYFTFQILVNTGSSRLGIIIPRGWGTAVERNRIKRLVREAFRRHAEIFFGMDTIVCPHEDCKGQQAEKIERLLLEEFQAAAGRR